MLLRLVARAVATPRVRAKCWGKINPPKKQTTLTDASAAAEKAAVADAV